MLRWKKGAGRRKEGKREKKKRVGVGTVEERVEEGGVEERERGRKKQKEKRKGHKKEVQPSLALIYIYIF